MAFLAPLAEAGATEAGAAGEAGGGSGLLSRFASFLKGTQGGGGNQDQEQPIAAADNQSMISDVTSRMQGAQSDL